MIAKELSFERFIFTARCAAKVVNLASSFKSDLYIEHEHLRANLKSLIGLISIRLKEGDSFTILAEGDDETEALEAIEKLFKEEL